LSRFSRRLIFLWVGFTIGKSILKANGSMMENKEQKVYIFLSIVLLIAIIGIVVFMILPKYLPKTPDQIIQKIDFSTSDWIEDYVEKSVEVYGKDFYLNSAFTYNLRSNKMVLTYATQKTVEEVRDHYLELPGAEPSGRNDETSLNISAELEGGDLRIYNYYSSISRVIELELVLNPELADRIIPQLEEAYPASRLGTIIELDDLVTGDFYGGYVRYRYDDLDGFHYPDIPIFSRAYFYSGTEIDYQSVLEKLMEAYQDHQYDETQDTDYFRINGQNVSVSLFTTDRDETVVSISHQDNIQE
jgi:hypothetical protein